MDFLKCQLCNIKELPKKREDRTDNTLYIYKGSVRLWRNNELMCPHNKRYSRCKECNLESYKKSRESAKKTYCKKMEILKKDKEKYKDYKKKNKERLKKFTDENKDYKREYHKEYHKKNKTNEKYINMREEYKKKNRERKIYTDKIYREKSKDKMKEYRKTYKCEHNKTPQKCIICKPYSYLTELQRGRIHNAINGVKGKHTIEYLGCDNKELYNHLEKQFKDGMTWENKGEWHIDHIRPCASFNLELEEERIKCFHYSNLQPLWASDNLSKGDKYDEKTHPLKWNGEKWIIF